MQRFSAISLADIFPFLTTRTKIFACREDSLSSEASFSSMVFGFALIIIETKFLIIKDAKIIAEIKYRV